MCEWLFVYKKRIIFVIGFAVRTTGKLINFTKETETSFCFQWRATTFG